MVSRFWLFHVEDSESLIHLFHFGTKANFFWMQLQYSFQTVIGIPPITPQSIIFGYTDQ